jgi:pyridoxal 5'-phosphate synthase pdxS subunit
VNHYDEPKYVAEISRGLGDAMPGLEIPKIAPDQRMQERGI